MKEVIISIKPQWCELIASGKKSIEVRKTKPKCEVPFKAFIYCTKGQVIHTVTHTGEKCDLIYKGAGKVIGEFICNCVDYYNEEACSSSTRENYCEWNDFDLNRACIHPDDFEKYANGNGLYGWHISDLVIYDKTKELSQFGLTRPPQSWCYVEADE